MVLVSFTPATLSTARYLELYKSQNSLLCSITFHLWF